MRHSALTCPLLHTASCRTRKHIAGFKAVKQLESPNMWLFFKTWRQPITQSICAIRVANHSFSPTTWWIPAISHIQVSFEARAGNARCAFLHFLDARFHHTMLHFQPLPHTAVTHRKRPCSTCSTMNCRLKWNKEEFSDLYRVCTGMCDLLPSCCWFHLFGSSCKTLRLALSLHWCVLLCLHYALWNMFLS